MIASITVEVSADRKSAEIALDGTLTHFLDLDGRSWVLRSLRVSALYALNVRAWRSASRPRIEDVIGEAIGAVLAGR